MHLESPIFEIFDEIETRLIRGLRDESLTLFVAEGWIDEGTKHELSRFRNFVDSIDERNWNRAEFDYLEDWALARNWARSLMNKLKLENKGWNTDGEVIIFTKKTKRL